MELKTDEVETGRTDQPADGHGGRGRSVQTTKEVVNIESGLAQGIGQQARF